MPHRPSPHSHQPRQPSQAQSYQLPPTPTGSSCSNSRASTSSQLAERNRTVRRRQTSVQLTTSRTQGPDTTPNASSDRKLTGQRHSGAHLDRSATKIPGPCVTPQLGHARQSTFTVPKTVKTSDSEKPRKLRDLAPSVVQQQTYEESLTGSSAIRDSPRQQAQHQYRSPPFELPPRIEPEPQPRRFYIHGGEAAKSHPVLRYRPPAISGETAREESRQRGAEDVKFQAGQDVLSPMYFTMMYKNSRSHKYLAVDPVNNNLEPQSSYRSLRKQGSRCSDLGVCEEESEMVDLTEDENQAHYSPTENAEGYFPDQMVATQGIQQGMRPSIDQSKLHSTSQHIPHSSRIVQQSPPQLRLPKKQTNQTGFLSKVLSSEVSRNFSGGLYKAAGRVAAKEGSGSDKKELKQRISAGRLNVRSFSWGNGLKSSSKKQSGVDGTGGGMKAGMDKPGRVLDRVRKFEALGSKAGPETRGVIQKSNSPLLTATAAGCVSSAPKPTSSLRQYFQGKGKEYTQQRMESRNHERHPPSSEALAVKRRGNQEQNTLKRSFSLARPSGLNVHQPSSMAASRVNPKEAYKHQNPDGGRFPVWRRTNPSSTNPRTPTFGAGPNPADSSRRKTDGVFYARFIPTPPQFKEQNKRYTPAQASSGNTLLSSISSRCNMAYWSGRYSSIRDIMRQEALDIPVVRATADYAFFEESETSFMEAVFCRLIDNICQQMDVEQYTEQEIKYLGYFKKAAFKRMEVDARSVSE